VTILDFSILASTFGLGAGDPGFDPRADFNQDTFVTILDFSLLAANFGQCGAPDPSIPPFMPIVPSAGTVVMAVVPSMTEVNVGETFEIVVEVQAGEQEVDGASAYLNFDPAIVRVDAMVSGGVLPIVLDNRFDNSAGTLNFAAGTFVPPFPSGTFNLVTIQMTALAVSAGSALDFNAVLPRQTNVTSGGVSVFDHAEDGTVVVIREIAPVIGVDPTSLEASQPTDTETTQVLTMSNTGDADLDWNIAETETTCATPGDIPWLSTSLMVSEITPPGGSSELEVVFDSMGLAMGNYTGTLCINSNDPTTPLVEVPVSLQVTGSEMRANDVVIDFGSQYGIWAWMNNASWADIHSLSPISMVIGDIDGSGQDDIIIDFGEPIGIWVWLNNSTWVQLHTISPESMTTGNIDAGGLADVIIDFGSTYGIWIWLNNSTWVQLHTISPESMTTGDIDGGGLADVIIDFGSTYAIWVWMNNSSWVQLHTISPESMTTGDIDGGGLADIIIDFGSTYGIWVRMNNSIWVQLHSLSANSMTTGDMDGNGQADVIIDFGSPYGIWLWLNNSTWVKLHSVSPESMTTGYLDNNAQADVVIDFGSLYGIWVRMNNSSWVKLHSISAESMVTGNIDGLPSLSNTDITTQEGPAELDNAESLPKAEPMSLPTE